MPYTNRGRWEPVAPAPENDPFKVQGLPRLSGSQPELGEKVRFVPATNLDHSTGFGEVLQREVTGTVVQIHAVHRWYRAEYTLVPGCIGHECFKF